MLSEKEKEELIEKHQGIVHDIAKRYGYYDEKEELIGWGNIGLVRAINYYEKNPNKPFVSIAFSMVKTDIMNQYKRNRSRLEGSEISLQQEASVGGKTIEDYLGIVEDVYYTEEDIIEMIEKSLKKEKDEMMKNITIEYYMGGKDLGELSDRYSITKSKVKKLHRRGKAIIIQHLINNDYLINYAFASPSKETINRLKIVNHRKVHSSEFGKIKFLFKYFSQYSISIRDVAILMNTSTYMITKLVNYKTADYLDAPYDETIEKKAMQYFKDKYPERMPSDIKVYKISK
ncbi:sigma-70 family RNA polymerase sigma factor [Radiobacillus sp. PE A8.2]|uniref:sigma-70 family RNA polymerase sigma factor n=1 Tax=Radiobacillus sp. PE A8.2 TaxID=3380349 RepID=UPI00388F0B9E